MSFSPGFQRHLRCPRSGRRWVSLFPFLSQSPGQWKESSVLFRGGQSDYSGGCTEKFPEFFLPGAHRRDRCCDAPHWGSGCHRGSREEFTVSVLGEGFLGPV